MEEIGPLFLIQLISSFLNLMFSIFAWTSSKVDLAIREVDEI